MSHTYNRKSEEKKSTSGGYGSGSGYSNRETAYTFNDGTTVYSNATRWEDAAKEAGNTSGLKSAVTYMTGKSDTEGLNTSFTGNIYTGSSPKNEKAYRNAMRYESDLWNEIFGNQNVPDYIQNNRDLYGWNNPPGGRTNLNVNPHEFGEYKSPYSAQIEALMKQLLNREAFSYDYSTDPIYLQYAQSYNKEGQRASQDAMAQAAALTGGLPSSYAVTAANQAGNYYASALNDKIPELYLQNYDMYLDQLGLDYDNLNALMNLESTDYGRWLDAEQQKYQAYRDAVSDDQWSQQFEYGKTLDSYNISQDQLDREDAAKEKAKNWVLTLLQMGITPSESELEAAGIIKDYVNDIINYYRYGSAQSSYSSGKTGGSGGPPTASTGRNDYKDISTYKDAVAYLKGKGLSDNDIMTEEEWARHKANSSNTGPETWYGDYRLYLQDVLEERLNRYGMLDYKNK